MSNKKQTNADLHDRLLDTALREVVGQETPPDLSMKILAAAGTMSHQLATLRDEATTTQLQQVRRKRNLWIGAALAPCLLLGAMIARPAFQGKNTKVLAKAVVVSSEEMPALSGSDLTIVHDIVFEQLRGKTDRYQALSFHVGGTEGPSVNAILNMRINEVLVIQSQIVKAKEELVELDVLQSVPEQQGGASPLLEQAIAKKLEQDSILQNYKAEEFAISSQIRTMKAPSKGAGTSAGIKRLMKTYRALQEESQKYRMQAEKEVRKAFLSGHNDFLSKRMIDWNLQREATVKKISQLENEYEEKVAEIEPMGSRLSELSLLEIEIEELQKIESALEYRLRHEKVLADGATDK